MTHTYLNKDSPLLVIIGPSAAGKSTIMQKLISKDIVELTPSWTDRPRRGHEASQEHIFVTPEELDERVRQGFFVHEPLRMFGLPYRYALPRIMVPPNGKVACVIVRASIIPLVDRYYPKRTIYQIQAARDLVEKNLKQRANKGEILGDRLKEYDQEVTEGAKLASRTFINTTVTTVSRQIMAALQQDFTDNFK